MRLHVRALLGPTAALLLATSLPAPPAFAQDSQEPAEDKQPPAAEKSAPAESDELGEQYSPGQAAEALRRAPTLVSQSGDLNISVEANWFEKFPGFDLETLSPAQRDWLLKRANAVFCTCGCKGDTVARCVVMDPTCQTARDMLTKMQERAASLSEEELARQAAEAAARAEAAGDEPE